MANNQLREYKDEAHTKLRLALFTADLEDHKELAARVAHLESEWARAALAHERYADAQTGLVAAAAAYKTLGRLAPALHCLVQASMLRIGDVECRGLLAEAIVDLRKALNPAPAAKPPANPAPKAEKKPEARPLPKAKPLPKVEAKAAAEEKQPEKKDLFKKKKKKKKAKKKP